MNMNKVREWSAFFHRFAGLALPYWRSEERWRARILLAVIVGLTLGGVFLLVLLNEWNRQFFNAIQDKDFASFGTLLIQFCVLAAIYIVGAVYKLYFTQMLQMRWRIWLTNRFVARWLQHQLYYRLELADRRTDNPDQRISEDLNNFTSNTLSLGLGLLSSVVTLISFISILWVISGPLDFVVGGAPVEIPGYMVWVAIGYAFVGSILAHLIGRPLIGLSFNQQRLEADFRYSLVRVRENAEGIALYGGEAPERTGLMGRVEGIRLNWWQLMRFTKRLTFMTVGYDQIADIFPILVAAPRYFSGAISLGVLTQIGNAFGQVQGSLSWFIESYGQVATWKATVDRLLTFEAALDAAEAAGTRAERIEIERNGFQAVRANQLNLALPNGHAVQSGLSLDVEPGERLLIDGPTGVGKSTLFRAIAGIWPYGSGQIEMPADANLLFLPQRPYIPIGTLRDAVAYPAAGARFTDAQVAEALTAVGLPALVGRIEESQNWSIQLSGGEQQRLALARALLNKPDWLFLDEATAALDEASERELYELLEARLPRTTIVSIAHRTNLIGLHDRHITLSPASSSTSGDLVRA
ncbi:MAG: ABC transporter ATP-binding protein/permease [Chloroflexi bacterium]|nr:ABC transporter ATP-binding protein/permease [Chloroflexota bacterium]